MAELAAPNTARAAVEAWMLRDLAEGTPSMDDIARTLGVSRKTLYRRLMDEGVSFAGIHGDLRRHMAMDCLGGRKVSMGGTA
jgi:AraC-like DNA-binding protein